MSMLVTCQDWNLAVPWPGGWRTSEDSSHASNGWWRDIPQLHLPLSQHFSRMVGQQMVCHRIFTTSQTSIWSWLTPVHSVFSFNHIEWGMFWIKIISIHSIIWLYCIYLLHTVYKAVNCCIKGEWGLTLFSLTDSEWWYFGYSLLRLHRKLAAYAWEQNGEQDFHIQLATRWLLILVRLPCRKVEQAEN